MPFLRANIHSALEAFLRDDSAATAIEYGLITAAMCTAVVASVGPLADSGLWDAFTEINDRLVEFTSQ